MLTITSFILSSIWLVYSPFEKVSPFPNFNCYESFTLPILFLRLFFYTPTGPEYIIVHFSSKIHNLNNIEQILKWENTYHFKRVTGTCSESNIIFTTSNITDSELYINIVIYISKWRGEMSSIHYSYKREFISDEYLLIDERGNFGILAKVTHSNDQFMPTVIADEDVAGSYLRSLKNVKNNNICIITKNNHQIVIKPKYGSFSPEGYIVGIKAEIEHIQNHDIRNENRKELFGQHIHDELLFRRYKFNFETFKKYEYDAFECIIPEDYFDIPTFFITEGNPNIRFYAIYIKFDQDHKKEIVEIPFWIQNLQRRSFDRSLLYHESFNKVFLMNKREKFIDCPDGTRRITYNSKDDIVYYVTYHLDLYVNSYVKSYQWVTYSIYEPCGN